METTSTSSSSPICTAEIVLYGTRALGYGWLARHMGRAGLLGTGQPRLGIGLTAAIWEAQMELRDDGADAESMVSIIDPCGRHEAVTKVGTTCWAGDLRWTVIL